MGRDQLPRLLEICARFAGQLTNLSEVGRTINRDHKTVAQYLRLLEQLYLLQSVLPWTRNELSRLVKTPKLHFVDSGVLAALRGHSVARLRADRTQFGPLQETFVFSELLKATAWSDERISIYHYRDKDKLEVRWRIALALSHLSSARVGSRSISGTPLLLTPEHHTSGARAASAQMNSRI